MHASDGPTTTPEGPVRPPRRARHRLAASATVAAALVALGLTACVPLDRPADVSGIQLVSTTVDGGYRIEYYRNLAYPCSASGHQTFAIGYPEGLPATTARPLWTYLHGGGVGWFDDDGTARPEPMFLTEESLLELRNGSVQPGLTRRVLADPAGFRFLAVSMCNRDLYSGAGQVDANNPNLLPDGSTRTTNGLLATKAAVQFAHERFATTDYVLHGGSAGSVGTYSVGWSLQLQGLAPAGIVADSFVINHEWIGAVLDQGVPCPTAGPSLAGQQQALARLHPRIGHPANEPHRLVERGELTVPIAQVWNHGDPWGCGAAPMNCPLPDGTVVRLGAADCQNEPLRRAIAAQGPSSRSMSLGLCVGQDCRVHVVTDPDGTNTDPTGPADYNGAILAWVHQRLTDR